MKTAVYIGTCILVLLMPLVHVQTGVGGQSCEHGLLSTFQGSELIPVEMSEAEQRFYADFPGKTGAFALAGRRGESIFLRYTNAPTRMMHSADGCYKASGFRLEHTGNVVVRVEELSGESLTWSQFRVVGEESVFLVRQCVVSLSSDKSYADVPSWYWQTMFSSSDTGPWLAVTWKVPSD